MSNDDFLQLKVSSFISMIFMVKCCALFILIKRSQMVKSQKNKKNKTEEKKEPGVKKRLNNNILLRPYFILSDWVNEIAGKVGERLFLKVNDRQMRKTAGVVFDLSVVIILISTFSLFLTTFVFLHILGMSKQSFFMWSINYGLPKLTMKMLGVFAGMWSVYLILIEVERNRTFIQLIKFNLKVYFSIITLFILFLFTNVLNGFAEPELVNDDFYKTVELKNDVLKTRINDLLKQCNLKEVPVYVKRVSDDFTEVNANANPNRIIIFDSLLKKFTDDEIISILGHEIGHIVFNHSQKNCLNKLILIVAYSFFSIVLIYACFKNKVTKKIIRKVFSITRIINTASIPLIFFLLTIIYYPFSYLQNHLERKNEIEADLFGLKITRNAEAAISSLEKMERQSRHSPKFEIIEILGLRDHPTTDERTKIIKEANQR